MNYAGGKLTTIITWMAAFMAILVGLGLPLAYFSLSYFYQNAELTTEVEINARIVTRLINDNPDMWHYEQLRLEEMLKMRSGGRIREIRRVLDLHGVVVAESVEQLPPPVLVRRSLLRDSGRTVGTLEIRRSMLPLLGMTALMAFAGCLLGFVAFTVLRTIPIRALRESIRSLYEEKERAQVTLHSIGDGVITTDIQGTIVIMNAVAEKLTGWAQDEARGKSLGEVFRIVNEHTREICESPVDRVLRDMRTIELDNHTVLLARDGTERIIADSGAPIRGADGSVIGVVLVFRDETERRRTLAERQKVAKLESLGVLAGGIAHDFNNLLGMIMGNISMAMMDAAPDSEMFRLLEKSERACVRATNLTYQLLTFSKGGTPVKESVSLAELIRSSAEFVLTGSSVRLEISLGDLPSVHVDPGQINRVMHNLILNAVEAMPGGGVVSVHADRVSLGKDGAIPLPEGEYVHISVQDNGIGIPKERLGRIFDPYFTTKEKGSGLGLSSAFSILRNHHGHISVDSEEGRGTTVHLYLPACSSAGSAGKSALEDSLIRGRGTILCMDDEEDIRVMTGDMLRRMGYEVVLTGNGSDALDRFREAKTSGTPFDAVILDLTVPGGMGGKETIRKMLEVDPGVKAILSSGYSEDTVMSDFIGYGFRGVIDKPYDIRKMSTVLHRILRDEKV